jgi:integrase
MIASLGEREHPLNAGLVDDPVGEPVARVRLLHEDADVPHQRAEFHREGQERLHRREGLAARRRRAGERIRERGGLFLTVCGKGGKTRTVRVSAATAKTVRALRGEAPASAHVFAGRTGALDPSQAWRMVRAAAVRAGIEKPVSPHFLRHAHASHAIDRGELLTTVRDTLGHSSIAVTDRYAHARPGQSSSRLLAV